MSCFFFFYDVVSFLISEFITELYLGQYYFKVWSLITRVLSRSLELQEHYLDFLKYVGLGQVESVLL